MFGLSHSQVAEKVGRSREYVSNSIRLLGLPEKIQESLKYGKMSEGHARTLLMLNDRPEEQDVIFREILLKKMSVREVERIVRKIATDKVRKKTAGDLDSNLIEFEKQFTETLGTRVQIQKTDFGGKLTIDYFSVEDLEGMLEKMKKDAAEIHPAEDSVQKLAEHTPLESVTDNTVETPAVPSLEHSRLNEVITHHNQSPQSTDSAPDEVEKEEYIPQDVSNASQAIVPDLEPEQTQSEPEETPSEPIHHQPFASRYAAPSFASPRPIVHPEETSSPEAVNESTDAPSSDEIEEPLNEVSTTEKPQEDESNLYSIRNFNV